MYDGARRGKPIWTTVVLKHALLGLLGARPSHGYDLKSAFEDGMAGTWPVNAGQIYTTLSRLERDGLVDCEVVEQDDRPDRKVYRLTDLGGKELEEWLEQPIQLSTPLRDDLYVKTFVLEALGNDDLLVFLDISRAQTQAALAAVEDHQRSLGNDTTQSLLLDAVSFHLQATLRWIDRATERLSRR